MLTFAVSVALLQGPSTLLDHVKEALTVRAGSAWAQTRLTGSAQYYGLKHDYSLQFRPDGKFVQVFKGPIGETYGSDGTTFWEIDRSRGVEKLDLEDRDRQLAVSQVLTDSWIGTSSYSVVSGSGTTLQLRLKPSGQVETVHVDPKTWLPTDASLPDSSGNLELKFKDWKQAGDRLIPTHIEISDGGMTDVITVEKQEAVEEGNLVDKLSPYDMPEWQPDDIVFDSAKPAAVESKLAISGHILVHPLVNGKDVGWFILDSGAEVMVIDKTVADSLKLDSVGKLPMTGVGGTVESAFRPVAEFRIGPAAVKNILFTELDLAQIGRFLGIRLAGVVGDDLMRRSVVTIDLKGPVVEIRPRDGFALQGGQWLPLRFSSGNPAVEATVDGAPKAWFRFDTGANGTVTLHTPFVNKYKLLEGKKTSVVGSGGVGGMVTTQAGTVKWFELAGHRFENQMVLFATSMKGAFGEPYLAGNIGQDFMKPFRIVLDYSGYRIALIPR